MSTPGAQIGFTPTETAFHCFINTPNPYFFDFLELVTKT